MNELDGRVKSCHSTFYDRLYTPWVMLLTFIAQLLDSDGSCRQAVSRLVAQFSLHPHSPPLSQNTATYDKARLRLPLAFTGKVIGWVTQRVDAQVEI